MAIIKKQIFNLTNHKPHTTINTSSEGENKMKSFGRYMILESKEDLKEARYDDYLKAYYCDGGYFEAPEVFPACYRYFSSPVDHSCGDWNKCSEDEVFADWDEWLNKYTKFIADAKELFRK